MCVANSVKSSGNSVKRAIELFGEFDEIFAINTFRRAMMTFSINPSRVHRHDDRLQNRRRFFVLHHLTGVLFPI